MQIHSSSSISVLFILWGCSYIIRFSIKYINFQFLKAKLDINYQVSYNKKQLIFKCEPRQSAVSAVKNALQMYKQHSNKDIFLMSSKATTLKHLAPSIDSTAQKTMKIWVF